ncbi:MAG: DinB family protein [Bryobacteraceae bacterium]|nr:DinB family protein [Bryobacteraceae bacterium]
MFFRTFLALPVMAALACAQAPAGPDMKTVAGSIKARHAQIKGLILRTAEKMPEDAYSFKPVDTVKSFGEIMGHVADSQYFFCSAAGPEKAASPGIEKSAKTKAEIIAGLKTALAFCDKAYDALTDASAAEAVKFGRADMSRAGVLQFNSAHMFEHYGNFVTYMRMKGLVPPSSER